MVTGKAGDSRGVGGSVDGKTALQALQVYIVDTRLISEYCEGYFLALPRAKGYLFNRFNSASYLQCQAKATRGRIVIGYLGKDTNNLT